ncbi:MAG: hypothetical protein LBK66_11610 [Spirochaetaceae bacterium]|jgi:hypothetical protein|nr:hypothetical protein [Spirochaetaceae bacterium]
MTDYDFFDLTHLPFDPPEQAAQKVTGAIEKSKKELVAALSSATQQLEHDEITGKQSFLDTIIKKGSKDSIIGNDDKLTPAYSKLAEDKVKKEIEKLRAVVLLLPSHKFTDGTIRRHSKRTMLSEGHVKEVFRNAGFTEIPRDELFNKHYPKFPKNADIAYKELEALRNPENKKWTDFTAAEDLYAFAACMAGEPEKAAEYRGKSTSALKSLFDGFAGKLSGPHDKDPAGHLCSSLATYGKTYVFDTEDHRRGYEAHLKYKNPSLTELFAQMKSYSSSKQDLLDRELAEVYINKISAIFGCDYMVSVNIYNKEAGLQGELYIPARFEEEERRKREEETRRKQEESTAAFEKYFAAAEQALRKSDFELARIYLSQAQAADPGKKIKTDELAARISAEERRKREDDRKREESAATFEKYFAAAEQALSKSDFELARRSLSDAQAADPGKKIKIDELAARISAEERRKQEEDARRKQEEDAIRKQEEDARRKQEESAAAFAKYFAAAEQALLEEYFELARNYLFEALDADPGEKSKTDELAARISAEERRKQEEEPRRKREEEERREQEEEVWWKLSEEFKRERKKKIILVIAIASIIVDAIGSAIFQGSNGVVVCAIIGTIIGAISVLIYYIINNFAMELFGGELGFCACMVISSFIGSLRGSRGFFFGGIGGAIIDALIGWSIGIFVYFVSRWMYLTADDT